MSGGITWFLVSRLVTENNQQSLAGSAVTARNVVTNANCMVRNLKGGCTVPNRDLNEFRDLLALDLERVGLPGGDRLLVLNGDAPATVVYDSSNGALENSTVEAPFDSVVKIANAQVQQGTVQLNGTSYMFASTHMTGSPFARTVMVVRPTDLVTAEVNAQLFPNLLWAGGGALLLGVLVSMFMARAMTRPLQELTGAAGDIAAGNYERRVTESGPGEVGVVARSFNRMAEAVERARRQQRDFLADVSHELKTPLTSLIGFSEAMVDGSLETGEERERAARIVNEEAHRVLRMAQELLDLARVEAGHVTYHVEPVDLGGQLDQEASVVRPRAERRGLRLRVDVAPDLPPVLADPERLHQILDNLVDNAIKYAPERTQVSIVADPHPHWVITEVRNQVGAHRPDTERMFDRFYRADPARSSSVGGVGLGLAISSELAAAQGGHLMAYLRGDWLHVRLALPAAGDGNGSATPPAEQRTIP